MAEPTKYPLKVKIAGFLLSLILRFIFYTSRKRYTNLDILEKHLDGDQPFIVVSWHNRNILSSFAYLAHRRKGRDFTPLSSASKDGSFAAAAMHYMGVECIRGSSSKGGSKALRQMLRAAKQGKDIGITPDGPRGPKYRVQEGVITTARLAGTPIIPMTYQARRRKELNSWDSMIVPYPFNRLHYVYGEPIQVPRDADEEEMERLRLAVEREMMRICDLAEDV